MSKALEVQQQQARWIVWEKFFTPLDRHFDDGHEATADSFKAAAEKLEAGDGDKLSQLNAHLPINYLYRHAIELYLKSAIVTVHRALRLPSGDGPHEKNPLVKLKNKWERLDRTHSLKALLTELDRLITEHNDLVQQRTSANWNSPADLRAWIETIEAADRASTYFRYAISGDPEADSAKSSFQPIAPEELSTKVNGDGPPGAFLIVLDDDDNVVEAFGQQGNILPELREALKKSAELLAGAAYGLHAELVGGYGRKPDAEEREG